MTINSQLIGLALVLVGYLLGSIPSGYLAAKWIAGVDLRELGSGSTGATNVLRQIGKFPALIVFFLDVGKGTIAIAIARTLLTNDYWHIAVGLTALAGHIWPIWLEGKGGKAVATGLGILVGISWQVGLSSLVIFIGVFSITRIVSLSSIFAALSLPITMLISFHSNTFRPAYLYLSIASMLLVVWRHRSNFKRLLNGTEPRVGKSNKI